MMKTTAGSIATSNKRSVCRFLNNTTITPKNQDTIGQVVAVVQPLRYGELSSSFETELLFRNHRILNRVHGNVTKVEASCH